MCEFDSLDRQLDEDEYPDEADAYNDDWDEADVIDCPACGAEVYEDTVRCPVCGEYVTTGANAWAGRPVWWIVLGAAGAIATIVALVL